MLAQWEQSPQGERRADTRAALNTIALMSTMAVETPQQDRLQAVLDDLTGYTPQEREKRASEIASPQQAAATLRGSMGGRRR